MVKAILGLKGFGPEGTLIELAKRMGQIHSYLDETIKRCSDVGLRGDDK